MEGFRKMSGCLKGFKIRQGERSPQGATADDQGINFSLFSRYATAMELVIYESAESRDPLLRIPLDPEVNRTYYTWHIYVEGLTPPVHYTWHVDGPNDPQKTGFRFDREKALVDPFAKAVTQGLWDRGLACRPGNNDHHSIRGLVPSDDDYDWEGDAPLNHPLENAVIYELHVAGFTRHPSSRVAFPGTYAGIVEKIPYLKELGVTDVELMPVMAFDEQDVPFGAAGLGLRNYWGYSTHSYYSPHPGYCTAPNLGAHRNEFRDMVKALHKAGIGVILDVVFNHTAEGGPDGPTINFRGIANYGFYHLDTEDLSLYRDYTGCGNTVNCNHPVVTRFIIKCLEYWVKELHVDGFRFDLASVLVRGQDGAPLYHAPVPWHIELSDVLTHTHIIAEAWDAGGLYQVGDFPGYRWSEWNGRYRDVMRRFVRGDGGLIGEVATRIAGSSDLYESEGRLPTSSINFITCHDGFTLRDLVSYDTKHNEANGEENRDGSDDNLSWNCGVEGETPNLKVLALRRRQARNFMTMLLISQGVPMILAGDEVLRTQNGNNNGYCQDNEISWFDWCLPDKEKEMLRFTRGLIALRKRHPSLMRNRFFTGMQKKGMRFPDVIWHGTSLNDPPWDDPEARVLAFTLGAVKSEEEDLHVMMNMSEEFVEMELPRLSGMKWHRAVDSWLASPEDILDPSMQPPVKRAFYRVAPRSVVVLESR
jgi:glycogen operon protein